VKRRLVGEFQNLDATQECDQSGFVLLSSRDTSTPYSSSDFVMTEMHTSLTGTFRSCFTTASLDR
jgi:hypothetical protein